MLGLGLRPGAASLLPRSPSALRGEWRGQWAVELCQGRPGCLVIVLARYLLLAIMRGLHYFRVSAPADADSQQMCEVRGDLQGTGSVMRSNCTRRQCCHSGFVPACRDEGKVSSKIQCGRRKSGHIHGLLGRRRRLRQWPWSPRGTCSGPGELCSRPPVPWVWGTGGNNVACPRAGLSLVLKFLNSLDSLPQGPCRPCGRPKATPASGFPDILNFYIPGLPKPNL